jgi:hypothetical protein
MISVRRATRLDVPWLLTQLEEFASFFGSKHSLFPKDPMVAVTIVTAFVDQLEFFLAVDHATQRPVGFIAGALNKHPMNPAIRVLSEVFWWVTPDRRGSSAGARLLERFLAFGEGNADWIVMTLEAKSPVDPASLERRGFHQHERTYLLEV